MIHLVRKARSLRLGWNQRPFTEPDFHLWRLRQRPVVQLVEAGMDWPGFYTHVLGQPTILIDARLRGLGRLKVLAHEMGHHVFHAPATCFFSDDSLHKAEEEARMFAVVALIPRPMIKRMLTWNLFEEDLLPVELLRQRLRILELYGI